MARAITRAQKKSAPQARRRRDAWLAKRLKELEQENSKLKRLVAELSLDKQILQDIARGNF